MSGTTGLQQKSKCKKFKGDKCISDAFEEIYKSVFLNLSAYTQMYEDKFANNFTTKLWHNRKGIL